MKQNIGRAKFLRKVNKEAIFTLNCLECNFSKKDVTGDRNLLKDGTYLSFNLNEKGKPVNLKILREVGRIKWLKKDYYNNVEFGVIELIKLDICENFCSVNEDDNVEIFFHKSQIKTNHSNLNTYTIVCFNISNNSYKNRDNALNLSILSEESDPDLIKYCVEHENKKLWQPLLASYLKNIQDVSIAKKLILSKKDVSKQELLSIIPQDLFLVEQEIRNITKPTCDNSLAAKQELDTYLDFMFSIIKYAISQGKEYSHLIKEINTELTKYPDYFYDKWKELPDQIFDDPIIDRLIPPSEMLNLISKQLKVSQDQENLINWASQIIQTHKISLGQIPQDFFVYPSLKSVIFPFSSVNNRPEHSEVQAIKNFVQNRGIKYLVHLTTINNLEKICQSRAILSREKIRELKIASTPFDYKRLDGKLNHICCSISYYNFQMFYHQVHKSAIPCVLLFIKPDFLWKQGTLFSPINAASNFGECIGEDFWTLSTMFTKEIEDNKGLQTRDEKPDNLPTSIQAEVLIQESISLEDVSFFAVDNCYCQDKVIQLTGKKEQVCVNSSYFAYRSDWINKDY